MNYTNFYSYALFALQAYFSIVLFQYLVGHQEFFLSLIESVKNKFKHEKKPTTDFKKTEDTFNSRPGIFEQSNFFVGYKACREPIANEKKEIKKEEEDGK